jgi:hypothetical protein
MDEFPNKFSILSSASIANFLAIEALDNMENLLGNSSIRRKLQCINRAWFSNYKL